MDNPTPKINILYFDDSKYMLTVIGCELEKESAVTTVNSFGMSVDDALDRIRGEKPDIVISDIEWHENGQSNRNGLVLAERLNKRFPLLLISSSKLDAGDAQQWGRFCLREASAISKTAKEMAEFLIRAPFFGKTK